MFSKFSRSKMARAALAASLAVAMVGGTAGSAFASLSGTVNVGGSTTVQPLAQLLANYFHKANPHVTVNVAGGGSGAGINGAEAGTFDIGMSSNTLDSMGAPSDLKGTAMARDAVTVIVNPKNKVKAITWANAKKIWTGQITNWKQLGGANEKIVVCGRAAGSGTGDYWNKNVMGDPDGKAPWTGSTAPTFVSTLKTYNSNGELKNAVAGNKDAIGYVGMAYATSKVRGLKFGGYLATRANAKSGKYPLVRQLWWVTKGAYQNLSKPAAVSFINYSLSSKGQAVVNKLYISLK
jgi:phosphate transport system substrate-binding protein